MTTAICQGCKSVLTLDTYDNKWSPCRCSERGVGTRWLDTKPKEKETGIGVSFPTPPLPKTKKWSNAVKTSCAYSHRHASKMEARVCERLTIECKALKDVLLQQVRLPILTLPGEDGRVKSMSIDFVILREGRLYRLIDAKAKGRVSRDWPARKRALELSWHVAVEEVDR